MSGGADVHESVDTQTPEEAARSLRRVAITTIAVGRLRAQPDTAKALRAGRFGAGWEEGPLPLTLRAAGRPAVTADSRARRDFLDTPVAAAVLGTPGGEPVRFHRRLDPPVNPMPFVYVWAVEVLDLRISSLLGREFITRSRASRPHVPLPEIAILVQASIDPAGLNLADLAVGLRKVVPQSLPKTLGLGTFSSPTNRDQSEIFRLVMVTKNDSSVPKLSDSVHSEHARHWASCLAQATLPRALAESRAPDFDADDEVLRCELPDTAFIAPSADWRIAVLQTGAAFVGRRSDSISEGSLRWLSGNGAVSNGEFFDAGEQYVRTIYADTLLLAAIQRHALLGLRDAVLDASRLVGTVTRARELETVMARTREDLWWTTASRGGPAHRMLTAYHQQHSVVELLDQLQADAESITRRAQLSAERGKAGALALLTLLGLLSVSITVARGVTSADRAAVVWALAGFIPSVMVVLLVFGDLRRSIRDAFRMPSRYGRSTRRGRHARRD